MPSSKWKLIKGDTFADDRGFIRHVNDFNFKKVKRFYHIDNVSLKTIRAFHAHKKEAKYVYVVRGTVLICLVRITDFKRPSKKVKVERLVLSDKKPQILYIPQGYANGLKSLEKDTSVIFYSTSTLKESEKDDFRYPYDYWGKEIWRVKNR